MAGKTVLSVAMIMLLLMSVCDKKNDEDLIHYVNHYYVISYMFGIGICY